MRWCFCTRQSPPAAVICLTVWCIRQPVESECSWLSQVMLPYFAYKPGERNELTNAFPMAHLCSGKLGCLAYMSEEQVGKKKVLNVTRATKKRSCSWGLFVEWNWITWTCWRTAGARSGCARSHYYHSRNGRPILQWNRSAIVMQ